MDKTKSFFAIYKYDFHKATSPTIEGYQRMYNMIAAQCSYLFDM